MVAIMTFTMVATAQDSEKKLERTNVGVTYVADMDAMEYGMWGLKCDYIRKGLGMSMNVLTNTGVKGIKFEDSTLLFKSGPNYSLIYTNDYGFYIPMLLNFGQYFIHGEGEYSTSKTKYIWGLSLEPTVVVNLGGLNLSVGLDVNWYNTSKELNTGLAFGVTF